MAPSSAEAFRTLQDDPTLGATAPVVWEAEVVELVLSEPAAGVVDTARLEDAIRSAALTWSSVTCATVSLVYRGRTTSQARPSDGVNTIEIVTEGWEARGLPAGAGATTDVRLIRSTDPESGESVVRITEADLYLNFSDFSWGFAGDGIILDIGGVLTHEQGHVLGMEHGCELDGAPLCTGEPSELTHAMHPVYTGSSQRWLSHDDVAGLEYLYPNPECGCPAGQRYESGICVAECAEPPCDGACTMDGQCRDGSCAITGPSAGMCIPLEGYGAECLQGADCASRLCLSTASYSYCTMACILDGPCGAGKECVVVAGSRVCAPARPTGGCSVGAPESGLAASWGAVALALLVLARRARPLTRRREVGS